jgi:hypothetical protein
MRGEIVASALLLASTAAFGAIMVSAAKSGGFRVEDPDPSLPESLFQEWAAVVIAFGLTGLSIDAFGRWLHHYSATGVMLSPDEISAQYE